LSATPVDHDMSRKVVLIVDDDADIREILAETLGNMDFDCATAVNGLDALTVVRKMAVRPSIILLDLMMPVMDGYAFLEQRRRDPTLAAIPVAIVTAGHGVDRDRLAEDVAIIPKPFDMPRLLRMLNALGPEAS
jgi:CheY-like chemotaxis protein